MFSRGKGHRVLEKVKVYSEVLGNERGVTLIEILTVIGILAIVAALAYPNFKDWLPGYRLKRAARNLFPTCKIQK